MRTLLFCTSWAATRSEWALRYRPWIDHHSKGALSPDFMLLVDDMSPCLPEWPDLPVGTMDHDIVEGSAALMTFPTHLGRLGSEDGPGWYRSMSYAFGYAKRHNFDRVIHVESDAAIITKRASKRLLELEDGWLSFWTPRYSFPEVAIQSIAGSGLNLASELFSRSYDWLRGQSHEWALPLTDIVKDLVGDRYNETQHHIPRDADWATQLKLLPEPTEMFWLANAMSIPDQAQPTQFLPYLLSGWSHLENGFVWSIGSESSLQLNVSCLASHYCLAVTLAPFLTNPGQRFQRVTLRLGSRVIGYFIFYEKTTLRCDVPIEFLQERRGTVLTIDHPDHFRPCDFQPNSSDERSLAVAFYNAVLYPLD